MAKVLVQGAPTRQSGYIAMHCEFTCNIEGGAVPEEHDLVVDLHRISVASSHFPREKRVFATNESPLYLPYFTDLGNIAHIRDYYKNILTNDVFLLGWPNAMYANLHYKWATPKAYDKKLFGVSAMFSAKAGLPNYELRHEILANQEQIRIPRHIVGPGGRRTSYPLQCQWEHPSKDEIFKYMFTLAIENCCSPGYFTEKIIDAFVTHTVPVYLGCQDIGKYFEEDGIIVLDKDNWVEQLNSLNVGDYYSRIDALVENYERAKRYWDFLTALDVALYENGLI